MSEILALGEAILAAEQAKIDSVNAALAVSEVRDALPQILDLLQSIAARVARLEMQTAEMTRAAMAPRIRRPVRDAAGTIQYVVDEIRTEEM